MPEKKNPQYYEGILQLREPTKDVLNYFRKIISRRGDVSITKEIKVKNGYDFYLTSNKALIIIGKKLFSRFGGEQKISRKLYGVRRATSKKLYRITLMFRPPKFKIGDVVDVRGMKVKVKMLKRRILGMDIKTGKKIWFDYDDVR